MGNVFEFFEQGSIEVTSFSNVIDNDHSDNTGYTGLVSGGDTIEYTVQVTNVSNSPISNLALTTYFQGTRMGVIWIGRQYSELIVIL